MKNWLFLSNWIIIIYTMVLPASGQNLVPNGSFEEITSCPDDVAQLSKIKFFFNPNLGSPDLMASCALSPKVSVPKNGAGYQKPQNGLNYAHFGFSHDLYLEYISVPLNKALENSKLYQIHYYLSLADHSPMATDKIGVLFSINKPKYLFTSPIPDHPQVVSTPGLVFNDTTNWTEVVDTFQAAGGEKYITIGQFFHLDSLKTYHFDNGSHLGALYYIDNVSLYELKLTPTVTIPNVFTPNHDGVNDLFTLKTEHTQTLHTTIFNRWGNVVFESNSLNPAWDGTFNTQPVAAGVYFVVATATSTSGEQTTEKQSVHVLR